MPFSLSAGDFISNGLLHLIFHNPSPLFGCGKPRKSTLLDHFPFRWNISEHFRTWGQKVHSHWTRSPTFFQNEPVKHIILWTSELLWHNLVPLLLFSAAKQNFGTTSYGIGGNACQFFFAAKEWQVQKVGSRDKVHFGLGGWFCTCVPHDLNCSLTL